MHKIENWLSNYELEINCPSMHEKCAIENRAKIPEKSGPKETQKGGGCFLTVDEKNQNQIVLLAGKGSFCFFLFLFFCAYFFRCVQKCKKHIGKKDDNCWVLDKEKSLFASFSRSFSICSFSLIWVCMASLPEFV